MKFTSLALAVGLVTTLSTTTAFAATEPDQTNFLSGQRVITSISGDEYVVGARMPVDLLGPSTLSPTIAVLRDEPYKKRTVYFWYKKGEPENEVTWTSMDGASDGGKRFGSTFECSPGPGLKHWNMSKKEMSDRFKGGPSCTWKERSGSQYDTYSFKLKHFSKRGDLDFGEGYSRGHINGNTTLRGERNGIEVSLTLANFKYQTGSSHTRLLYNGQTPTSNLGTVDSCTTDDGDRLFGNHVLLNSNNSVFVRCNVLEKKGAVTQITTVKLTK
ncbi:hypothetical protein F7U66_01665 [Vibrio parahaemolyticus]|nr:hypothetical protein [Vibrio parahaemolyticus]